MYGVASFLLLIHCFDCCSKRAHGQSSFSIVFLVRILYGSRLKTSHYAVAMWATLGLMLIVQVLLLQQRAAKAGKRTRERHEQHTMMQLLVESL